MSQLLFGNLSSVITAILGAGLFAYLLFVLIWNRQITKWGRKVLYLALWGFALCCAAAFRDDYMLSVQQAAGESIHAGRFAVDSIVSQWGSIGGIAAAAISLSCLFIRKQGYRKFIFFALAVIIIGKIILVEYARFSML